MRMQGNERTEEDRCYERRQEAGRSLKRYREETTFFATASQPSTGI